MEQDKTKILSDLYAIRATMSVVAMNEEKVDDLEQKLIKKYEENYWDDVVRRETSMMTRYNSHRQVDVQIKKREEEIQRLSAELDQYERELERAEKEKVNIFRRRRHRSKVQNLRSLCSSKKSDLKSKQENLEKLKKVVDGILTTRTMELMYDCDIEFDTYKINFNGKTYSFAFAFIRGNYRDCEERQRIFSEYLRIQEELSEQYRNSYGKLQKSELLKCILFEQPIRCLLPISDFLQYMSEEDKEQLTDTRLQTNKESNEIVKIAQNAYPLIDFRDWENVDLLIYYFETGRADDMKEALQLVDRQRQTDQITEAIEAASESICKTINVSMAKLGSALSQSFSVLSRQMARQHSEMMARMDLQAEAQREMSEAQSRELRGLREQAAAEMSMQVSAQAMNEALLNKISVSSKHLAEQMDRQMREVHGLY